MTHPESNGRSRVNWNTFFAGCGLLVTIGGLAVYAIISPIQARLEGASKVSIAEHEITDLKIKLVTEVMNARLVEIETQFRAADQSRNVQFATQQRIDAMLWEKTFGSRYPSDAIYYPQISK